MDKKGNSGISPEKQLELIQKSVQAIMNADGPYGLLQALGLIIGEVAEMTDDKKKESVEEKPKDLQNQLKDLETFLQTTGVKSTSDSVAEGQVKEATPDHSEQFTTTIPPLVKNPGIYDPKYLDVVNKDVMDHTTNTTATTTPTDISYQGNDQAKKLTKSIIPTIPPNPYAGSDIKTQVPGEFINQTATLK